MKIVIINGSPRKNGATAKLLTHIEIQLKEIPSTHVDVVHLTEQNIMFCTGCSSCFRTGKCHLDDDGERISTLIGSADGIVIGTPTYASNISGLLKNFIDRGHFVMEQLLIGKKAFHVVTYENAGAAAALKILNNLSVYSGASVSSQLTIKTPFGKNPLDNMTLSHRVQKQTNSFIHALQHDKKRVKDRFLHSIVFHVGIKPYVLKRADHYQGVIQHWPDHLSGLSIKSAVKD